MAMENMKRSRIVSVLDAIVARGADQQANRTRALPVFTSITPG
jgi:CRISPR/Cas system-associated protein Cas7 (RAMP superfamily)